MNPGLYRSEFEHDACGIGSVVNVKGNKSHETISDALLMLSNMEHRGGRGSDPKTGDGAGILIQMPHTFLKDVTVRTGFFYSGRRKLWRWDGIFSEKQTIIQKIKKIVWGDFGGTGL